MKGRLLANGDIVFPYRGKPPAPIKGYYVDAKNPFVHHPIFPDCDSRIGKPVKSPCCAERIYPFCTKEEPPVITNFALCSECKGTEDHTVEALEADDNDQMEEMPDDLNNGDILVE